MLAPSLSCCMDCFSNVMTTNGIRTDAMLRSIFTLVCMLITASKRTLIEFLFPLLICVHRIFSVLPMCLPSGFDMLPNGINFRHLAFYAGHCCSFRSIRFYSVRFFVFQTHNINRDNVYMHMIVYL